MVSYYPAYIDTSATLPPFVDGQPVTGAHVEKLRETIIAIEAELGIKPSGVYTTVRARLDALETALSNLQIISLTKDLGGTLAQPKVIGIQGRPVSDALPLPGQVLVWNGIAWAPAPGPSAEVTFGGDLEGDPVTQRVIGINTIPVRHGRFAYDQGYLKAQYILNYSSCVVFDGTDLWVSSYNNDLVKINPATPEIIEYLPLPNTLAGSTHQAGLAYDDTHVYYGCYGIKPTDSTPIGRVYIVRKSNMAIEGVIESQRDNGNVAGIAVSGNNIFVASADAALSITSGSGTASRIDKYSKSAVLTAYPAVGTPIDTLAPSEDNAYHGGFLYHDGWLYVTSFTVGGRLYKIDPGNMTIADQFTPVPGSVTTNLVYANGYIWTCHNDTESAKAVKFDLENVSNYAPTTISGAAGYGNYLSVHDGRWLTVTHGNSPFIETVDTTDGAEAAYDIDLEDGGLYGVSYSDGTYVWTCNASSGPLGIGIYAMHGDQFPNISKDHFFGGPLEIAYATIPSSSGAASNIFVFRPGGSTSGNYYSTWGEVMAARSQVSGPATIVVDDSLESPAFVEPGIWDLGNNTKIEGFAKGTTADYTNRAHLSVPINGSLQNPSEFENVRVRVAKWDPYTAGLQWTDNSVPNQLILRDAHLQDGQNGLNEGKSIYFNSTVYNRVQMFGNSVMENDDNYNPIFVEDGTAVYIDMYDSARVQSGLFTGNGDSSLCFATISVYGDGCALDDRNYDFVTLTVNYYTPGPLIYQPGGGGSGAQRILTTWNNVMNARSTIIGPATIVIDDQVTSPAAVDAGTWDLMGNTTIVGAKSPQINDETLSQLAILDGATFINPIRFENLTIVNFQASGPAIESIQGGTLSFNNVIFMHDASAGQSLILAHGGIIDFYGSCHLKTNNSKAILENAYEGDLVINLHDQTVVDGYTIKLNYFGFSVTINVTDRAFYDTGQPQVFIVININQANLVQSGPYTGGQNPNIITYRPTTFASTLNSSCNGSINLASNSDLSGGDYNTILGGSLNFIFDSSGFPNWSSILGGRDHSISGLGDFNVIVGGEDNHISDSISCGILTGESNNISGNSNESHIISTNSNINNGSWAAIVGGNSNSASAVASGVFCGVNGIAQGDYAVVLGGDQGYATGLFSAVLAGEQNFTSGNYSVAMGNNARAIRDNQFAHALSTGNQFSRFFSVAIPINGGVEDALPPLILEDSHTYSIKATCVANRQDADGRALFIRNLFVHCVAGTVVILDETIVQDFPNGEAWTLTFSVVGQNLVATFDATGSGGGSVVVALINYEWTEVAGF